MSILEGKSLTGQDFGNPFERDSGVFTRPHDAFKRKNPYDQLHDCMTSEPSCVSKLLSVYIARVSYAPKINANCNQTRSRQNG
jgi:hypothetical protein